MAATTLGSKAVGDIVKIKVDDVLTDFIVVQQGRPSGLYDASCNGTWLLMKNIYEVREWNSSNSDAYVNGYANAYAKSEIHSYLNSTLLGLFDANIRGKIKQVKIPYVNGTSNSPVASGANGLETKIILLSGYEVGFTQSDFQYFPIDGSKLAYFDNGDDTTARKKRDAKRKDGSPCRWWLRSPETQYKSSSFSVETNGSHVSGDCFYKLGIRPAMILDPNTVVLDDGTLFVNTAPGTPSSLTVPSSISGGSTITISWGASTDTEGNLEGYIVERSTDGGSTWSQIYQGSGTSTTNSVAFGTASVMYRVKAYDSEGLQSGYRTSSQVSVVNNRAPNAPASITVPNDVKGGGTITVTWGAASDSDGNLSGYELERSVSGGAWTQVYKGSALSYTDTITKGWASVAYRVRAYDSLNVYSGYTTSPTRTVDNNTAPTITCTPASGGDLGTKTGGFTVSYSIGDVDGDAVTVTEAMDGTSKRTFQAALGSSNSFAVTGEYFQKLLNGKHTMAITASDGKVSAAHTLTFTKSVTSASITLEEPMEADALITICVLSVAGFIPADAAYKIEVTNNGKDSAPVWEDCTAAVKNGANYLFTNKTAANGFAFNFRVTASRGSSGQGGYINSVQGGFQ